MQQHKQVMKKEKSDDSIKEKKDDRKGIRTPADCSRGNLCVLYTRQVDNLNPPP